MDTVVHGVKTRRRPTVVCDFHKRIWRYFALDTLLHSVMWLSDLLRGHELMHPGSSSNAYKGSLSEIRETKMGFFMDWTAEP